MRRGLSQLILKVEIGACLDERLANLSVAKLGGGMEGRVARCDSVRISALRQKPTSDIRPLLCREEMQGRLSTTKDRMVDQAEMLQKESRRQSKI